MKDRTEVFDRAIDRLRDMIAATKSPLERDIGELLTQRLTQGLPEGEAAKLLDGKKDLKGAAQALEEYARKLPRKGNCVGFGDCTALPVLLGYFGIEAADLPEGNSISQSATDGNRLTPSVSASADSSLREGANEADALSLDALLGGL